MKMQTLEQGTLEKTADEPEQKRAQVQNDRTSQLQDLSDPFHKFPRVVPHSCVNVTQRWNTFLLNSINPKYYPKPSWKCMDLRVCQWPKLQRYCQRNCIQLSMGDVALWPPCERNAQLPKGSSSRFVNLWLTTNILIHVKLRFIWWRFDTDTDAFLDTFKAKVSIQIKPMLRHKIILT